MKITYEKPNKEFLEKYKHLLPEDAEVKEVYEYEIPWYRPEWWTFRWWQFVMWLCERIIPDLKKEPNEIWFGHKNSRGETKQSK